MNEKIRIICENILKNAKKEPYKYGFWCIIVLFLIPGLIWILYFVGDNIGIVINTSLTVGDALGFYAALLSFIGTVVLAGAALWQNQAFRLESRRKEEYAIRPYLFSEIEDRHIDILADNQIEFLQITIESDGTPSFICASRNRPDDVTDYVVARQIHRDFLAQPMEHKLLQTNKRTELISKELRSLLDLKKKYELVSYCLENHGTGSAVKIKTLMNNQPISPLFCLSHEEKKQLYFLINAEQLMKGMVSKFNITIEFYNVEDFGPYRQTETFLISKTETGDIALIIEKQISSPVLVKKEATTDDKA